MSRRGPRPLAPAVESFVAAIAPAGLLGEVQRVWADAVGPVIAAEARPVAERDGTVTVACASAVWAHELALLAPSLVNALNTRLAPSRVSALRCRTGR